MVFKNIDQFIDELFRDFNPKQRKVVNGRFGLTGARLTLQEIGDDLGVTRERVRQIEEDAIKRLRERVKTEAAPLLEFAVAHLERNGGVRRDDKFVPEVVKEAFPKTNAKHVDNKVRLLFVAAGTPLYQKENDDMASFWYANDSAKKKFSDFIKNAFSFFKGSEVHDQGEIRAYLAKFSEFSPMDFLSTSKAFGVNVFGDMGLREWAEIEPKTIRDKTYLVLKKQGAPLHFKDIAKNITKMGIDKESVHVQTVHNELIKDNRFVLVGRGMYALKEFGFEPGTVREVIARVLKKNGPMQAQSIVSHVNKQRFLKENTILLSLQNRRYFKRLDDGRYHVREA